MTRTRQPAEFDDSLGAARIDAGRRGVFRNSRVAAPRRVREAATAGSMSDEASRLMLTQSGRVGNNAALPRRLAHQHSVEAWRDRPRPVRAGAPSCPARDDADRRFRSTPCGRSTSHCREVGMPIVGVADGIVPSRPSRRF
jgi:hypothetical protein